MLACIACRGRESLYRPLGRHQELPGLRIELLHWYALPDAAATWKSLLTVRTYIRTLRAIMLSFESALDRVQKHPFASENGAASRKLSPSSRVPDTGDPRFPHEDPLGGSSDMARLPVKPMEPFRTGLVCARGRDELCLGVSSVQGVTKYRQLCRRCFSRFPHRRTNALLSESP